MAEATVPQPELAGVSVVLQGDFNAAIVHPAWLAANGLIRQDEATAAKVEIVARDLTHFTTEWLDLLVTADRFQILSSSAPTYDLVRDLVVGVFKLLSHTPVRALGVNHHYHFRIESEERWHAFGHKVAPKEIWEPVLKQPGTRSLVIQAVRPDEYQGNIFVQTEPSLRIENGFGVYIAVNDHFQLDAMDRANADAMIDVLEDVWSPAAERAELVTQAVMNAV